MGEKSESLNLNDCSTLSHRTFNALFRLESLQVRIFPSGCSLCPTQTIVTITCEFFSMVYACYYASRRAKWNI